MNPRIVLCAPGPWKTLSQLAACRQDGWELRLDGRNPGLVRTFAAAPLPIEDQARIGAHVAVALLTSRPYAREDAPRFTHDATRMVLELFSHGAAGVWCETSGVIHPPNRWIELSDQAHLGFLQLKEGNGLDARYAIWEALYDAWVHSPATNDEDYYTCGMQLFAYADCAVARAAVPDAAAAHELMRAFSLYLLAEFADMQPGNTFRIAPGAPRFIVSRERDTIHDPLDLPHNPRGRWRLTPG